VNGVCGHCRGHGEARGASAPKYRLVPVPDTWTSMPGNVRLEHACICEHHWVDFSYDECFRGMGFVAGKTPPRGFRDVIFGAGLPSHVARHIYDVARRRHADEIRDLGWERYFDDFASPTLAELREVLAELKTGRDFIDNERVAEKGKPRQMRRYRRQQAHGCCGRFDVEVKLHGRTFLMGFNHGH
jgi:hypothetical protein